MSDGDRMAHGVTVRGVREEDLPAVTPLAGSPERARHRLAAATTGAELMLVAERAGELVGVVSVRWRSTCDPPHPWLYGLHVAERHRGAGTGTTLVRRAEAASGEAGATHLSLDVDVDDGRARRLYERLGYAVVGPHDHHWRTVDPGTGDVLASGTSRTWLMRRAL